MIFNCKKIDCTNNATMTTRFSIILTFGLLISVACFECAFQSIAIAPINHQIPTPRAHTRTRTHYQPVSCRKQSQLNVHNHSHSHTHQNKASFDSFLLSRRNVLNFIPVLTSLQYLVSLPKNANAESSMDLPNGLLEARVLENVLSPPPYEMECSDIFYPR
jgi:hypothetical protein